MNSNGKVALVTGGGSGIGKASALALAEEGFAVVVAGRRAEPLQAVVNEIESKQGRALGVPTDVGDPEAVRNLFAKIKQTYGRLDVLFNNAGFGAAGPIEELPYERWKGVIDSILNGSFLCTQEAFKIMKDQKPMGGRIINNGSISAHVPRPDSAAYTSAKHAVIVEPTMDVQNVARAVVFMATVTDEANVQFLTVMATKMPFIGRG